MPNQDNKNNGAEIKFTGHALTETLNQACSDAHELYRNVEPDKCAPVMTGCRFDGPNIVMPLNLQCDGKPSLEDVAMAKRVAQWHKCDYVLIFYPVLINRQNDDTEPDFGVIVEIQPRGLPSVKRLVQIDRKNHSTNQPPQKLPVLGRTFGMYYPHLLEKDRAA